jgi:hypothetical protein
MRLMQGFAFVCFYVLAEEAAMVNPCPQPQMEAVAAGLTQGLATQL